MNEQDDPRRYDDIIELPHHVSSTHPPLARADRAAQFSPFAALTGHEAALNETARLTEPRRVLTEDEQAQLDRQLVWLREHLAEQPPLTILHYVADEKKAGGSYISSSGRLRKIDVYCRQMQLADGRRISLDDIAEIVRE